MVRRRRCSVVGLGRRQGDGERSCPHCRSVVSTGKELLLIPTAVILRVLWGVRSTSRCTYGANVSTADRETLGLFPHSVVLKWL